MGVQELLLQLKLRNVFLNQSMEEIANNGLKYSKFIEVDQFCIKEIPKLAMSY